MIKLKNLLIEETLKTLKGSTIKRYKNQVGKLVGSQLYVHRKYASEVIPNSLLKNAVEILKQKIPTFQFNSVMWDHKTNLIRFDEVSDFDTAREPHVGKYIAVFPDGNIREGQSNNIWHHKWLWVKDDYQGFDVNKSMEWSKTWLGKVPEIAKGTDNSFKTQLQKYGLEEELRSKSDEYYYHVTLAPYVPLIQKEGLKIRGKPVTVSNYKEYSKGKIFFSDLGTLDWWVYKIAEHAFHSFDDEKYHDIAIFRVKKINLPNVDIDKIGSQDSQGDAFYTVYAVPPSVLEFVKIEESPF